MAKGSNAFPIHIIPIEKRTFAYEFAERLYEELNKDYEVLFDDRDDGRGQIQ